MKTLFWSLSFLFLGFVAQAAAAETKVEFRVRELWREVTGHFEKVEIQFSPQIGMPASLAAKIDATTINTGIDARDAHLRTADFSDLLCPLNQGRSSQNEWILEVHTLEKLAQILEKCPSL